jgi:DNA-binding Lrp family transcriptional regulator
MDKLDEEIVNLVSNGCVRYTNISRKLGIPTSTAHARIKRLEKSGVIRGYRGEIDWKKAGLGLTAYILVNIDVDVLKRMDITQERLLKRLLAVPFVTGGDIITGESDLLIRVVAKDTTDLREIILGHIGQIGGIAKTKTMIVLD